MDMLNELPPRRVAEILEACASGDVKGCAACPYDNLDDCSGHLIYDAARMIRALSDPSWNSGPKFTFSEAEKDD